MRNSQCAIVNGALAAFAPTRSGIPRIARISLLKCAALFLAACSAPSAPPDIEPAAALKSLGSAAATDSLDAPDPPTLSLKDAIGLALRRSPAVHEALAQFDGAAADARQARLLPNPTLDLTLRFDRLFAAPDVDAALVADLVAALTREQRAGIADERLRAACLDVVARALDESDAVRTAYLGAQVAEAAAPLLRDEAQTLVHLRDASEQRRGAGEASGSDVDALAAEAAAVEDKIRDAERAAKAARLALARRIARPESAAAWALDPLAEPLADVGDFGTWTQQAVSRRPELAATERETAALEQEASLIGKPVLGTLNAGPSVEHAAGSTSIGATGSVTLPLFDDGANLRTAARARVAASRHRAAALRLDVETDVRSAWIDAEAAREQIARLDADRLPALARRVDAVRQAFSAGEATLTESLVTERDFLEARLRRVELLRDFHGARRRLERAAGGVDFSVIEPTSRPSDETASPESHWQ